ncbi:MAG: IPT/TIG domain-containing protein [Bacteroidales bacterium]|jgi:hypothetical protein
MKYNPVIIRPYRLQLLNVIFIIILLFLSCGKDVNSPRDYPRVDIFDEILQSEMGCTFTAEILSEGISEIIDKGFVWRNNNMPFIRYSQISLGKHQDTGRFSGLASVDFLRNRSYAVSAYVQTTDYLVYSREIVFTSQYNSPPPVILDFNPKEGRFGDVVAIKGKYFTFLILYIEIAFGEIRSETVSCSDTLIVVRVPDCGNDQSLNIKLKIYSKWVTAEDEFRFIGP